MRARGWVITNNHVIEDADEITVTLRDQRSFKAKLLGTDPAVDVALLQIEGDRLAEFAPGRLGKPGSG